MVQIKCQNSNRNVYEMVNVLCTETLSQENPKHDMMYFPIGVEFVNTFTPNHHRNDQSTHKLINNTPSPQNF